VAGDGLKLTGFRELHDGLGEFTKATERAILRRVGIAALKPFVDRAKQLAPVDDGNLRDSITAGVKLSSGAKKAAKQDPAQGVRVFAGTANRNGVPREFGTVRSGAEPFMRPAWASEKGAVLDGVINGIKPEIEKARKRAAAKAAKKLKG
jgi:HK97 gp10 family phage protein